MAVRELRRCAESIEGKRKRLEGSFRAVEISWLSHRCGKPTYAVDSGMCTRRRAHSQALRRFQLGKPSYMKASQVTSLKELFAGDRRMHTVLL